MAPTGTIYRQKSLSGSKQEAFIHLYFSFQRGWGEGEKYCYGTNFIVCNSYHDVCPLETMVLLVTAAIFLKKGIKLHLASFQCCDVTEHIIVGTLLWVSDSPWHSEELRAQIRSTVAKCQGLATCTFSDCKRCSRSYIEHVRNN